MPVVPKLGYLHIANTWGCFLKILMRGSYPDVSMWGTNQYQGFSKASTSNSNVKPDVGPTGYILMH